MLSQLWRECETRQYPRLINGPALVKTLVWALVLRLPSLESILDPQKKRLPTTHKSTLSHALRRTSHLTLLRRMIEHVTGLFLPTGDHIIALDSMPVTISRKRKSDAAKINKNTKGAAAIWEFIVNAPRGSCPARLLKVVHGAWNDSFQILGLPLIAKGPLYLMDRGFYSFKAIAQWLAMDVRFIVRAKAQQAQYKPLKTLHQNLWLNVRTQIVYDGIVLLGAKGTVKVRLIKARIAGKPELILVTNLLKADVSEILAHYRLRWEIELFHKLLKQTLGMAHLFNFQKNGIEMAILAALLIAVLLYLQSPAKSARTLDHIRLMLKLMRKSLNIQTPWMRNSSLRKRKRV